MKMVAPLEVGICCEDLQRLLRFYVDVLDCELVSVLEVPAAKAQESALSSDGYSVARVQTPNGERLKLLQPRQQPQELQPSSWILERRNTAYLTFIVEDLDAVIARLCGVGAQLLTGTRRVAVRPGVWLCFARDPEGNVVEFVQYEDLAGYRRAPVRPGAAAS